MTNEEIYMKIKEIAYLKETKDNEKKNIYTRIMPNGKQKHYELHIKPIMKVCELCGEMHDMTKPAKLQYLKTIQKTLTTCQGGKRFIEGVEIVGPVAYY